LAKQRTELMIYQYPRGRANSENRWYYVTMCTRYLPGSWIDEHRSDRVAHLNVFVDSSPFWTHVGYAAHLDMASGTQCLCYFSESVTCREHRVLCGYIPNSTSDFHEIIRCRM